MTRHTEHGPEHVDTPRATFIGYSSRRRRTERRFRLAHKLAMLNGC